MTPNEVVALLASGMKSPLRAAGIPLDSPTKSFMESRLGVAFNHVRVHTGTWAAAAACALRARAFTFGHDIFFAEGEYAPQYERGLRLLAHELVHVAQQCCTSRGIWQACTGIGDPMDPLEAEAERAVREIFETGPVSAFHPDRAAVVRRVIRIDPNSVSMTVDNNVSKAKAAVNIVTVQTTQRPVAFAHLTEGVDLALAAAGSNVNGIVKNPVVKMSGKGKLVGDAGDNVASTNLDLNFIQIATVFQLEDTYAGRTSNEGHIKLHHRTLIRQNFLLDSITGKSPFAGKSKFTAGVDKQHGEISCTLGLLPNVTGDSPGTQSGAIVRNRTSNADNFLFELRCDLGFTTILVSSENGTNIQPLFHLNWKLLWHFQVKWKGGQNPTPSLTAVSSRADIGQQPVKGPPTDAGVLAVLQNPVAPFFNDVTDAAKINTFQSGPPLREDLGTALPGLPADFFT